MSSSITRRMAILGAAAVPVAARAQFAPQPGFGRIERLDPALDALIDASAPVEKVLDNFTWSEGPVWVGGADGYLLVSDPRANVIRSWSAARGEGEWLRPSGYAAGESPSQMRISALKNSGSLIGSAIGWPLTRMVVPVPGT